MAKLMIFIDIIRGCGFIYWVQLASDVQFFQPMHLPGGAKRIRKGGHCIAKRNGFFFSFIFWGHLWSPVVPQNFKNETLKSGLEIL